MNHQQHGADLLAREMRYQNGLAGPARTPFLLVRPDTQTATEPVTVPFRPAPGISDYFESRGLHRITPGQSLHAVETATGWSWTIKAGRSFRLLDAQSLLIAAFELTTEFDRTWHARAKATGRIVVYIGENLVPEDDKPVPVQLTESQTAGALVAGVVQLHSPLKP